MNHPSSARETPEEKESKSSATEFHEKVLEGILTYEYANRQIEKFIIRKNRVGIIDLYGKQAELAHELIKQVRKDAYEQGKLDGARQVRDKVLSCGMSMFTTGEPSELEKAKSEGWKEMMSLKDSKAVEAWEEIKLCE